MTTHWWQVSNVSNRWHSKKSNTALEFYLFEWLLINGSKHGQYWFSHIVYSSFTTVFWVPLNISYHIHLILCSILELMKNMYFLLSVATCLLMLVSSMVWGSIHQDYYSGVARAFPGGPPGGIKWGRRGEQIMRKIRKGDWNLRKELNESVNLAYPGLWGWLRSWRSNCTSSKAGNRILSRFSTDKLEINSLKKVSPRLWKQVLNTIQSLKTYIHNFDSVRWDLSFNLIPYVLQKNASYGQLNDSRSILKSGT